MSPNDFSIRRPTGSTPVPRTTLADAITAAAVNRERAAELVERSKAVVAAAGEAVRNARRTRAGVPFTSAAATSQRVAELESRLHELTNAVTGALLETQYQRLQLDSALGNKTKTPRGRERNRERRGVLLEFPRRPGG